MVPFDPAGLFEKLGGVDKAAARMDGFFYNKDGSLAVTKAGDDHAELANEPSIASPWLYDFTGSPWKTQEIVRVAMKQIWTNSPSGISGNDDLGEMSSWYVWAAMGMYPLYPGRADLVLGSPMFEDIAVTRPGGDLTIHATGAAMNRPYITLMNVDGQPATRAWLPSDFVLKGGSLDYTMAYMPNRGWGARAEDAPPSFGPM
jgi:putative alpha-1,2-mannosidase